jgi:hypothetical protein
MKIYKGKNYLKYNFHFIKCLKERIMGRSCLSILCMSARFISETIKRILMKCQSITSYTKSEGVIYLWFVSILYYPYFTLSSNRSVLSF